MLAPETATISPSSIVRVNPAGMSTSSGSRLSVTVIDSVPVTVTVTPESIITGESTSIALSINVSTE